jgi:hypothetical protein
MVSVIVLASPGALIGTLDVATPEQDGMSDEGADLVARLA